MRIRARGNAVLASAMLNRGTAFSEPERRALGLTGLLPSGVTTLIDVYVTAATAAGSPFPPVDYGGHQYRIAQANNALVFPGIGLGVTVTRARRIGVGMISAAAKAIASLSDLITPGAALLPPVDDLRLVSATIGVAVAQAAAAEGLAGRPLTDPIQQVHEAMWRPEYPDFDVI